VRKYGVVGVGRYEVGGGDGVPAGKLYDGCWWCSRDACPVGVGILVYGGLSTYVVELAVELGGGEGYAFWGWDIGKDVMAGGLKVVARWTNGCGAG
jgi:hypothetical protein